MSFLKVPAVRAGEVSDGDLGGKTRDRWWGNNPTWFSGKVFL